MSQKWKINKKIRRTVRREKEALIKQIALEMLTLPFRQRMALAWRIVWRSK